MERIERARMSATLSSLILSGAPGPSGIVSVTTISSISGPLSRSNAGPEKTPCVAVAKTREGPAPRTLRAGPAPRRLDQRAGRVAHVVDEDCGLAGHVTLPVAGLGDVVLGAVLGQ